MNKRKKRKQKSTKLLDGRITEKNFMEAVIDHENNQVRVYSNDMLLKRIQRDSIKIGKSFDKLCKEELIEISKLFSKVAFLVSDGLIRAAHEENEMKVTCCKLLMNAISTVQAAIELLRIGYILQPGMMLRSVIETIGLVAYFLIEEEGYKKYQEGNFDSNKTIKYGKEVIPPLGHIHGFLSNHFVHISDLHSEINVVTLYKEMIDPLRINLDTIKATIWSVYVASELVLYDYYDTHQYWTKIGENKYQFEQNEETKKWIDKYFKVEE